VTLSVAPDGTSPSFRTAELVEDDD
jgi:hypothetical protein